jgi:PurA ssDNA and RNA-binding protein
MISNDRSQPHGHRPYGSPKPPVNEETLKTDKVQIERKTFVFALKENPRGRFLRITEDVGGRRDTIIIPAPGLEDFKKLVDDMVKTSTETPAKTNPQPNP